MTRRVTGAGFARRAAIARPVCIRAQREQTLVRTNTVRVGGFDLYLRRPQGPDAPRSADRNRVA